MCNLCLTCVRYSVQDLSLSFACASCVRLYNIIIIILTLSMSIVISIENHVASKSDFMTCAAMQLALTHLNVISEILAH